MSDQLLEFSMYKQFQMKTMENKDPSIHFIFCWFDFLSMTVIVLSEFEIYITLAFDGLEIRR